MPDYVVLDTTALWVDLRLTKLASRVLLAAGEEGEYVLVLPEVVKREAVNHRRGQIRKLLNDLRSVQARLRDIGFGASDADLRIEDEEALLNRYEVHLQSAIEDCGGRVESIPDVSHDSLIRKALHNRKPFAEKGRGYRDALIWESVATLASSGEVSFITDNHSDFCASSEVSGDGTRQLHGDLVAELRERGFGADSVTIYPDVESFVKHQITDDPASWLLDRAEDAVAKLWEVIEQSHSSQIRQAAILHLDASWIEQGIEIMSPHAPEDVIMEGVPDIDEIFVDQAEYKEPGVISGVVLVSAVVVVSFQLEVYFDGERFPHPQGPFKDSTKVELKLEVEWSEEGDRLKIENIEGPYGGYIEVHD